MRVFLQYKPIEWSLISEIQKQLKPNIENPNIFIRSMIISEFKKLPDVNKISSGNILHSGNIAIGITIPSEEVSQKILEYADRFNMNYSSLVKMITTNQAILRYLQEQRV